MTTTTFTIPGKPFAKQRPRSARGRIYTPKETFRFERTVGLIALPYFHEPLKGPVRVSIAATFQPPKSWSKKKTAEHLNRPHTQRPDLDNCQKAILDGLNRIAFEDDSQVAEVHCLKVWGPTARTVVSVKPMEWSACE